MGFIDNVCPSANEMPAQKTQAGTDTPTGPNSALHANDALLAVRADSNLTHRADSNLTRDREPVIG